MKTKKETSWGTYGWDVDRERECLRCGEMFGSNGPHNRICKKCRVKERNNELTISESGCRRVRHIPQRRD